MFRLFDAMLAMYPIGIEFLYMFDCSESCELDILPIFKFLLRLASSALHYLTPPGVKDGHLRKTSQEKPTTEDREEGTGHQVHLWQDGKCKTWR